MHSRPLPGQVTTGGSKWNRARPEGADQSRAKWEVRRARVLISAHQSRKPQETWQMLHRTGPGQAGAESRAEKLSGARGASQLLPVLSQLAGVAGPG